MLRKLGPLTYDVETRDGRTVKRHADQLKLRKDSCDVSEAVTVQEDSNVRDNHQYGESVTQELEGTQTSTNPPEPRYPQRVCRPPDRYVPDND